jgi:hypothetical protein
MNRAEALKTLQLDGSADGHAVESAYWTLVRRAQRKADTDRSAWVEIERLNQAYGALAPTGKRKRVTRKQDAPNATDSLGFIDGFADFLAAEALRTRQRWSGRNPEIALIAGAALVLFVIALGAGASLVACFIVAAVLFAAIWAPWRRIPPAE